MSSTSARCSAGPRDHGLEPLLDVRGLEELPLALQGEVRRVAGGVRDRARVGHLVDLVDDLPGLAALEHGDDEPLVLLGQLAGVLGDVVLGGLDLDPEGRAGAGDAAADPGAPVGLEDRGGCPTAEAAHALDAGDHAVGGVAVLEPGGDQDAAVAAGPGRVHRGLGGLVELERHDHAREHDEVGDEQDGESGVGHDVSLSETLSDDDSTSGAARVFRSDPRVRPQRNQASGALRLVRTTCRSPATSTSNTPSSSQAWVTGPSART